jgi:hypothetical protein
MVSVNLINAIPAVLQFVEDTADIEAVRDERNDYKYEANKPSTKYFLMGFSYRQMVQYEVDGGEVMVLIRDVVNLPEFRERLANILGVPNVVHCTVHEVQRDLKIVGVVERDDAIVTFTFSRWNNHPLKQSDCLLVAGFEDPVDHVINRYGVCHCCGAYK